ncbi:Hypothetical_protein [Hexamita inflata]|uniref:Hypothetical_protein n=1 Tax=Hexamita inflata TaxID=28002 RepID=A0AA86QM91_9EUKA|nr:Hypothetical protein HINF_LOCUS23013 [Hexamita inflata]CAI9954305.1 Hypothetical protein HINF_LOCUS41950 [Hexamita inflata]
MQIEQFLNNVLTNPDENLQILCDYFAKQVKEPFKQFLIELSQSKLTCKDATPIINALRICVSQGIVDNYVDPLDKQEQVLQLQLHLQEQDQDYTQVNLGMSLLDVLKQLSLSELQTESQRIQTVLHELQPQQNQVAASEIEQIKQQIDEHLQQSLQTYKAHLKDFIRETAQEYTSQLKDVLLRELFSQVSKVDEELANKIGRVHRDLIDLESDVQVQSPQKRSEKVVQSFQTARPQANTQDSQKIPVLTKMEPLVQEDSDFVEEFKQLQTTRTVLKSVGPQEVKGDIIRKDVHPAELSPILTRTQMQQKQLNQEVKNPQTLAHLNNEQIILQSQQLKIHQQKLELQKEQNELEAERTKFMQKCLQLQQEQEKFKQSQLAFLDTPKTKKENAYTPEDQNESQTVYNGQTYYNDQNQNVRSQMQSRSQINDGRNLEQINQSKYASNFQELDIEIQKKEEEVIALDKSIREFEKQKHTEMRKSQMNRSQMPAAQSQYLSQNDLKTSHLHKPRNDYATLVTHNSQIELEDLNFRLNQVAQQTSRALEAIQMTLREQNQKIMTASSVSGVPTTRETQKLHIRLQQLEFEVAQLRESKM